jgi:hypothetical protein
VEHREDDVELGRESVREGAGRGRDRGGERLRLEDPIAEREERRGGRELAERVAAGQPPPLREMPDRTTS